MSIIFPETPLTLEELAGGGSPFYEIFKSTGPVREILFDLKERTTPADLHKYWLERGYPEPVTRG